MPNWKKIITSGSDASLNSLNVTQGITGSLQGTSSYALNATNADTLDGQHGSYYRNASNINAGTINDAYLPATISSNITGNAATATQLQTARTINGTSFNGTANITTSNWGTARTLTIGSTGKSVNGSGNVTWTLAEIGAQAALTNPVTGTGTTNYISKWTGTTSQGNSIIYDNGTNVGIGTASPSYKLDVSGTARFSSTITAANIGAGVDNSVVILDSDGTLRTDEIDSRVWGSSLIDGTGTKNYIAKWNDADTVINSIVFDNGSSVGINTITPQSTLDVNGSVQISQSLYSYSTGTVNDGLTADIASIQTGSFTAAFFDYVATSSTNARAGTVMMVWNGSNLEFTDTSTNDIGSTKNLTLSGSLSGGNVRLQGISAGSSWVVKTTVRML